MMATGGRSFRTAPRVETAGGEVRIKFFSLANFLEASLHNISINGMFIATQEYLQAGSQFHLIVEYGEEQFEGYAEVKWVRGTANEEGPVGMGIEFLHLQPTGQELIELIIAQRRNITRINSDRTKARSEQ